jgi:hypothetical protein
LGGYTTYPSHTPHKTTPPIAIYLQEPINAQLLSTLTPKKKTCRKQNILLLIKAHTNTSKPLQSSAN